MKFDVEYYDETHQGLLTGGPYGQRIQNLVAEGLDVDDELFLAHMLFTEQKKRKGYRTFRELRERLPRRIGQFEDYFDWSSGSIRARMSTGETDGALTERVGVAAALTAMNHITGLHEADWERIPVTNVPAMDFRQSSEAGSKVASTGERFLELEAKGSVVDRVDRKQPTISNHKASILKKKEAQKEKGNSSILVGAIVSIPTSSAQRPRIRLLDPPGTGYPTDPQKYRLLARLSYYARIIRYVSRLHMLSALTSRLATLAVANNYEEFDGLRLLDRDGEPYVSRPWSTQHKAVVEKLNLVGRAYPIALNRFRFHGHLWPVLDLIAGQEFELIRSYRAADQGTHEVRLIAPVRNEDLRRYDMTDQIRGRTSSGWQRIWLEGQLTVSASGFASGELKPNW